MIRRLANCPTAFLALFAAACGGGGNVSGGPDIASRTDGKTASIPVDSNLSDISSGSDRDSGHRWVAVDTQPDAGTANPHTNASQLTYASALNGASNDSRTLAVASNDPENEAVLLVNEGPTTTDFELKHNGHAAFTSMDQIVEFVRNLPNEVRDEPFERKLWRFVRDNTYHFPSISAEPWILATWPTVNSFGWGFCSHVAATYVQIAKAAGYEGRVWALGGHVVPEIRVNGIWRMYDPDLAVYYHKRDGSVAGVADLVDDPTLVSSPIGPIFNPGQNDWPYSQTVSDIYRTASDDVIVNYLPDDSFPGSRVSLPPGGRLIYPGQWTPQPIGYDDDGTPYPIDQFRQARIEIPAGYTGVIAVPWIVWDIQGSGSVKIAGLTYPAGSSALRDYLNHPGQPITELEAIDNPSGLALIMMINPLWYDMLETNEVQLTGTDIWNIDAGTYHLGTTNRPPPPVPSYLRKPRACGDGFGNRCDPDMDNSGGEINIFDYALFQASFGTADAHADFDNSGLVDLQDLAIFMSALGTQIYHADLNGNGIVDSADFALFRAAFGTTRSYGDLNYSGGTVNVADFAIFRSEYVKDIEP